MPIAAKKILYHLSIASVVLFAGFALSSGIALNFSEKLSAKMMPGVKDRLYHHIGNLEVDAKHYFLFSTGNYSKKLFTERLSFIVLASILANSIFNIIFQPVFFCPFIPQSILNVVLLPFFLYGSIRYFKKAWFMLVVFAVLSFYIGIYDSVIEALIRHGMSCELIYLFIGSAGFTGWITKNS